MTRSKGDNNWNIGLTALTCLRILKSVIAFLTGRVLFVAGHIDIEIAQVPGPPRLASSLNKKAQGQKRTPRYRNERSGSRSLHAYCIRDICIRLVAYKTSFYAGKARYPRLINSYVSREGILRERVRELLCLRISFRCKLMQVTCARLVIQPQKPQTDPRCRFVREESRDHVSACDHLFRHFRFSLPPPPPPPSPRLVWLIAEMG